ncbi:MAG: hypothetical protein ACTSWQ_08680 [Candidatus Thorarchaeota archaeon]
MITYANVEATKESVCSNYGRDQFGYGLKIATNTKAFIEGRWRRVYATCISNCASHWVTVKGNKQHIR